MVRFLFVALALGLKAGILVAAARAAEPVGSVSRVQGEAVAVAKQRARPLAVESRVHRREELRTGAEARLEVLLRDQATLTLGADATLTLDRFVLKGGKPDGLLSLAQGAFRLISGAVAGAGGGGANLEIVTPVATIGVRGTDVWGGRVGDEALTVILLEGRALVRTPAGSVVLDQPGQFTAIAAPGGAPAMPAAVPEETLARAVETVSFR